MVVKHAAEQRHEQSGMLSVGDKRVSYKIAATAMTDRSKRSGELGPIRATNAPDGPTLSWQKVQFPKGKQDLERWHADQFVAAFNKKPLLRNLTLKGIHQSKENSLDFRLETSQGNKWLELMEVAPFELFRCQPDEAPETYRPYELAQFIREKIIAKSKRYQANFSDGIYLLLYFTDWKFQPDKTAVTLLQYWMIQQPHVFEAVFLYEAFDASDGFLSLIAPTPIEFWNKFDPEKYRGKSGHQSESK